MPLKAIPTASNLQVIARPQPQLGYAHSKLVNIGQQQLDVARRISRLRERMEGAFAAARTGVFPTELAEMLGAAQTDLESLVQGIEIWGRRAPAAGPTPRSNGRWTGASGVAGLIDLIAAYGAATRDSSDPRSDYFNQMPSYDFFAIPGYGSGEFLEGDGGFVEVVDGNLKHIVAYKTVTYDKDQKDLYDQAKKLLEEHKKEADLAKAYANSEAAYKKRKEREAKQKEHDAAKAKLEAAKKEWEEEKKAEEARKKKKEEEDANKPKKMPSPDGSGSNVPLRLVRALSPTPVNRLVWRSAVDAITGGPISQPAPHEGGGGEGGFDSPNDLGPLILTAPGTDFDVVKAGGGIRDPAVWITDPSPIDSDEGPPTVPINPLAPAGSQNGMVALNSLGSPRLEQL